MVAEDGADALAMLGLMLEFHGFDVVMTADGCEAFKAVLVYKPDAVVSDMNMPQLDGLGLCQAVRALPATAFLPVILWSSAEADDPRLLEAIELGGVEFLSKSLSMTDVDMALRRILAAAAAARRLDPVAKAVEVLSSQALAALSSTAAA